MDGLSVISKTADHVIGSLRSWEGPLRTGDKGSFLSYVEMNGDLDRAIGAMNGGLPKSCPPVTKGELINGR